MTTQFREKYHIWARIQNTTMCLKHKPGDVMEVDWAGQTIPIYDSDTGNEDKAYLFIAVLPFSGYAYVEACADMKSECWIRCHMHAYAYFGGVTRLLGVSQSGPVDKLRKIDRLYSIIIIQTIRGHFYDGKTG